MLQDAKGLLDSMFNFDKDNIPAKTIEKLKPYIDNEEFTPKKIESASKVCTAMCQWVHAINKYYHVALEVVKVKGLEEQLSLARASHAKEIEILRQLE
eukprot:2878944-Prymnesium_polylepis.1